MVSLVIQTVLLMVIAFILGALVGCLLRRFFGGNETEVAAPAVETPKPQAMESTPPVQLKTPVVPKPPVPQAPVRPVEKPEVAKTPPAPQVSAPAPKAAKAPAAKPRVPKPTTPKSSGAPDNLKLIKGIGPQNEGRLNALGVSKFEQIAGWAPKDEADFGDALAFPGRIEREEWVKQAKVLAKGGATEFAKRVKSGDVESSVGKAAPGDVGTKPSGMLSAPRGGKADNLSTIGGVGAAIEKKMNALGVHHFDQIAGMSAAELTWLGTAVGFPGRPARENWAGEARQLASGTAPAKSSNSTRGQIKAKKR